MRPLGVPEMNKIELIVLAFSCKVRDILMQCVTALDAWDLLVSLSYTSIAYCRAEAMVIFFS